MLSGNPLGVRYANYLCQTEACASYGKSIARYKVEKQMDALLNRALDATNSTIIRK